MNTNSNSTYQVLSRLTVARKPSVILFDLWKTIARGPYPEPIKLLKDILGLGAEVSDEEFLVACLTTPYEDTRLYIYHVADRFGVEYVSDEAVEEFESLVQNEKNGLLLFTDVVKELSFLKKQGFRLGLVTNSWPFPVQTLLETTGLDEIFEHVISSHSAGVAKQHGPEIYLVAAERFGVRPEECLMIGDNPALDVVPALAADVQAVLIDRDGSHVNCKGEFKSVELRKLGVGFIRNLQDLRELHTR